jgi:hypothetical protein
MKKTEMDCCSGKTVVKKYHHGGNQSSAIYGLGVVGALFYFLQNVTTFMDVLTGIAKAIFWPAIIIFRVLTDLKI